MTSRRDLLDLSIDRLTDQVAQGTRLDLALEEGTRALADPARSAANKPVLVLLTDGVPNRVPTPVTGGTEADTVLGAAQSAKAAQTPNAEDLAAIYPEIAVTIACPRGRHDWSRPWP